MDKGSEGFKSAASAAVPGQQGFDYLIVGAGFAGLYYAVTILVDSAYRDQFVDTLSQQLRDTFERRSEYLDLLRQRGVAVVPGEPTGGHADPAVRRSSPESGRSSAT